MGGTVVGFMNNYGCYTHGATALAVSYPHMDVAIGYGKNTKRNPKKAALQCTNMIKKQLMNSKYKNKFLFNLVSGASVMRIPGQGEKKVVESGLVSKFAQLTFNTTQYLLQKGFGREDEVFAEIIDIMPEYSMILGTTMDDYRALRNYQFFNKKVITNAVLNLGIITNLDINTCTSHGMKKTDKKFELTKVNKYIIKEINYKSARQELIRILNFPEKFLTDEKILRIIPYYPISIKKEEREIPLVMPGILGNSVLVPSIVNIGEASILTVTGTDIVNSINKNLLDSCSIIPNFIIFSSCMTIIDTLGAKINIFREKIIDKFDYLPFIMIFSAGEGTYSQLTGINYANMSVNSATFGHHK